MDNHYFQLIKSNYITNDDIFQISKYIQDYPPSVSMDNSTKYTSYIDYGKYDVYDLQVNNNLGSALKKESKTPRDYSIWINSIQSLTNKIKKDFPEAVSAHIAVMHPNTMLKFHIDTVSKYYYRFHLPIISNNLSSFYFKKNDKIDQLFYNVKNLYYFDTSVLHSASNFGLDKRVHITWLMPIKTKEKYIDN